jgi:hypothetical protein
MPIAYKELLSLHTNTFKAAAMKSAIKDTARNPDLDSSLFNKYIKFQGAYKGRLEYLNAGQFVTPERERDDKCMPPLLVHCDSKIRFDAQQPDTNYRKDYSCAFDEKRIQQYELENQNFSEKMKTATAFVSLRELIVMDIAFIHLRTVKWAPKRAEHLTAEAAE